MGSATPAAQQLDPAAELSKFSQAMHLQQQQQQQQQPQQHLLVKVFCADGSTKSIVVDGTMCVGDLLDVMVEKNHVQLQPSWAIVEHLPDLYMERCMEDHENVMRSLLSWKSDAKNKLLFVPRPERFDLFRRPEKYLLGAPSPPTPSSSQQQWDVHSRQALLQDIFYSPAAEVVQDGSCPPPMLEIEGPLWLKSEGKKNWKKFYFVLVRSGGLYYMPANGKRSRTGDASRGKDLICAVPDFANVQIYYGLGWKKKYKSPTDSCFALKPPQSPSTADQEAAAAAGASSSRMKKQQKELDPSTLTKYLCAENDAALQQWVAAIRIIKNRNQLLENYNNLLAKMQTGTGKEGLYAAIRHQQQEQHQHLQQQQQAVYMTSAAAVPRPTTKIIFDGNESCSGSSSKSGTESVSSGCVSETASEISSCENGFDTEFPDGGTIRRKPKFREDGEEEEEDDAENGNQTPTPPQPPPPQQQPPNSNVVVDGGGILALSDTIRRKTPPSNSSSRESSLPPPPPPPPAPPTAEQETSAPLLKQPAAATPSNLEKGISGSDLSLNSLPPPPEELRFPLRYPSISTSASATGLDRMAAAAAGAPNYPSLQNNPQQPTSILQRQQQQFHPMLNNGGVNFPGPQKELSSLPPCMSHIYPGVNQHQPNLHSSLINGASATTSSGTNADEAVDGPPRREQLYPCGVFRSVFPPGEGSSSAGQQHQTGSSQMALLKQMPNCQAPLRPFNATAATAAAGDINCLGLPKTASAAANNERRRKITFSEVVTHINLPSTEPLKSGDEFILSGSERNPNPGRLFEEENKVKQTPPRTFLQSLQRVMERKWNVSQRFHHDVTQQVDVSTATDSFANHVKERDISNWILQSLKHSHIQETDMSQDLCSTVQNEASQIAAASAIPPQQRPKIYNGRSVPNCYPPNQPAPQQVFINHQQQQQQQQQQQIYQQHQMYLQLGRTANGRVPPPAPPKRNDCTQLTSPK